MRTDRNYSLDLLKIIATILIIFHHYQIYTGAHYEGLNFNNGSFYFGYMVELFFVISGYLIYVYVPKIESSMGFKQFWLKRYIRFLPMLIVTCIAFSAACLIYQALYGELFTDHDITLIGLLVAMSGFSQGWGFPATKINGIIWYISVLLWLYIVFYISIRFAKRFSIDKRIIWFIIILIGFIIKRYEIDFAFLTNSMSRGYIAFFTGLFLADFYARNKINKTVEVTALIFLVLFIIGYKTSQDFINFEMGILLSVICYPSLIIVFNTNVMQRIFCFPFIGVIGRISYDAFMWHFTSIVFLLDFCKWRGITFSLTSRIPMIILCLVTYIIGSISYFTFDTKLQSTLNKVIEK